MNNNKAHHKHTSIHTQTHLKHEEADLLSIIVEAIIHPLILFIPPPLTSRKQQLTGTGIFTAVHPSQKSSEKQEAKYKNPIQTLASKYNNIVQI